MIDKLGKYVNSQIGHYITANDVGIKVRVQTTF
jgi:hypothetical protein